MLSSSTDPPLFVEFQKLARFRREWIITEKIDGTNGQIYVTDDLQIYAGSRSRWLVPGQQDNFGFAAWVERNKNELIAKLGPGRHYGEWYGKGIQRGYGLSDRRFALFNTSRWLDPEVRPVCCEVVPVIHTGVDATDHINQILEDLRSSGSFAVPGFMRPEGVVLFSVAAGKAFKVTLENDGLPKSLVAKE